MNTPHTTLDRLFKSRLIWLSVAVTLGIGSGIAPDLSKANTAQMFAQSVRAQDFNPNELRGFAMAAMQIEPIRKSTLGQIKQIQGGKVPNLVCNQPDSMNALNPEAKGLFVEYCNRCKSIAEGNGISLDRFNEIAQALKSNPDLKKKIVNFMKG
jgi:hypothetical protein